MPTTKGGPYIIEDAIMIPLKMIKIHQGWFHMFKKMIGLRMMILRKGTMKRTTTKRNLKVIEGWTNLMTNLRLTLSPRLRCLNTPSTTLS